MKTIGLRYTSIILILLPLIIIPKYLFAGNPVPIKKGMVITHSITIKKSIYNIKGDSTLKGSVIEIKGKNIIINFNGALLQGSSDKDHPDNFSGITIKITSGTNITIENATIKGYKVAVFGRNVSKLKIENCNFSFNFRQHLNSNRQREDLSDWQSYHHNENDQWLRYGAGIYTRSCDSMVIRNDTVIDGQCGLMMTDCTHGLIYDNNFSFNSGIGIGLYQSSYNKVMNNKLDWNVRGFSYGIYARGQDAAAILVYEQSSHNIFAYNSATHSGDGFFLWAGASTMQTGKGGCNDNLVYENDFSYAPTNGVEVTFSRNEIIGNKIYGCDHGIWGGYSYNTNIVGNTFRDNNTGIAIEQGQNNEICENSFIGGRTGIHLWATPGRSMPGKYDELRDVRSMDYEINHNSFSTLQTVFSVSHSHKLTIQNNHVVHSNQFIILDSSVRNILIRNNSTNGGLLDDSLSVSKLAPGKIDGARNAMLPPNHPKGRQYIMMTEWGPYDFRSPMLWLTKTDSTGKMYFDILGPRGSWKVKSIEGISAISAKSGKVPGKLTVRKKSNKTIDIALDYSGQSIISPFGKEYSAGKPYIFNYRKPYFPVTWRVKLFSFNAATDPLKHHTAFEQMLHLSVPLKQINVDQLDNSFWNKLRGHLPASKTVTVATGRFNFPKGRYVIGISAGDIVRVYIDNKMVINAWDPSKIIYNSDYHHKVILPLKGLHTIQVVQAQYGDYGMLYLTIKQKEKK